MDPRAHIQYQTDLLEIQAHRTTTRGHVGGHQSNLEAVGATWQSAEHVLGQVGQGAIDPQPSACSFLPLSLSQFNMPRQLQLG